MQKIREIERKYELPPGGDLPPLVDLPGVAGGTEPESFVLEAVYFDTPDLRLAARGVTLRRRSGGPDEGWHLKLPVVGEAGTKDEIRVPLGRGTRTVPAELANL